MSDQNKVEVIRCGEVIVAASCTANSEVETPAYVPGALLSFARTGQVHVRANNHLYSVPRGKFVLLRKYTEAVFFKTFTPEEKEARGYNFILNDDFIRKAITNINLPTPAEKITERVVIIDSTPQLMGLMDSIAQYTEHGQDLEPQLVELKTLEALMALLQADANLASIFQEYAQAERADLAKFMHYHYMQNITLYELAYQSGRSLSTFNREFRATFNETPHKWILRKRLEKAKALILQDQVKPVDVYMQVGFEDLAHFSKAFKKQFNVSPSKL